MQAEASKWHDERAEFVLLWEAYFYGGGPLNESYRHVDGEDQRWFVVVRPAVSDKDDESFGGDALAHAVNWPYPLRETRRTWSSRVHVYEQTQFMRFEYRGYF